MRSMEAAVVAGRFLAAMWMSLGATALPARAETTVQVRGGTPGGEFGFLYGEYYRVDPYVVDDCTGWMGEPDFMVALHLARLSDIDLDAIVEWRRQDASWYDITRRCHLDTHVYYVDLPEDPGPPYGRAWGYWRKHPRGALRLSDEEIRSFVVLRAMSDYTGRPAGDILRLRKDGWTPARIAASSKKGDSRSPAAVKREPGRTPGEDTLPAEKAGPGAGHGRDAGPGAGRAKSGPAGRGKPEGKEHE